MRTVLLAGIASVTLLAANVAAAQTPPAPENPSAAPAAPETTTPAPPPSGTPAATPQPESQRRVCRDEARRMGLRGQAARDHMAVCFQQARLECTKKAVAQKVTGRRERSNFIRSCLGQKPRKPKT